jgi:hypothetical protein
MQIVDSRVRSVKNREAEVDVLGPTPVKSRRSMISACTEPFLPFERCVFVLSDGTESEEWERLAGVGWGRDVVLTAVELIKWRKSAGGEEELQGNNVRWTCCLTAIGTGASRGISRAGGMVSVGGVCAGIRPRRLVRLVLLSTRRG